MRTNIYIRLENEEAWAALENKSEWVNERLGGFGTLERHADNSVEVVAVDKVVKAPFITTRNQDMKFCKHNAVIGFCKKGCK